MKYFDTCTKNVCGRFGQNNCWHRLLKAAQYPINHPIWSHCIQPTSVQRLSLVFCLFFIGTVFLSNFLFFQYPFVLASFHSIERPKFNEFCNIGQPPWSMLYNFFGKICISLQLRNRKKIVLMSVHYAKLCPKTINCF